MDFLLQVVAVLAAAVASSTAQYQCSVSQGVMNCDSQELTAPPSGYWPEIVSLLLSRNPIAEFPKRSLSGFPNLRTLSAESTRFTKLDFGALVELPYLTTIIFENCQIETIVPPDDGEVLEHLQEIYLSGNKLSKWHPDDFLIAPRLVSLRMTGNPIEVDEGQPILNHPNLESLWLGSECSLGAIDSEFFSALPNLFFLDLTEASVTSINGAFVSNKKIQHLFLGDNSITQITSGTFPSEELIATLDLDSNPLARLDTGAVNKAMAPKGAIRITSTPLDANCAYEALYWWALNKGVAIATRSDCGFDTRRRSPDMAEQQMVSLLAAAGGTSAVEPFVCQSLESILECSGRGFVQPPAGYWPNTTSLYLNNNPISVLYPASFAGFPNVDTVSLSGDVLEVFDWEPLMEMQRLEWVIVKSNRISEVKAVTSGRTLQRVHSVMLDGNRLTALDPDFLAAVPNVRNVYLSENPIAVGKGMRLLNHPKLEVVDLDRGQGHIDVSPETFAGLPALTIAYLKNTGITDISGGFVTNTNLYTLDLSFNSITMVTAGSLPEGNNLGRIYLGNNPLTRLDVSALEKAMKPNGWVYINDTPLACECGFEELYEWTQSRSINLRASCNYVDLCSFIK